MCLTGPAIDISADADDKELHFIKMRRRDHDNDVWLFKI